MYLENFIADISICHLIPHNFFLGGQIDMNKNECDPYSVLSKLPDSISDITPDYEVDSLLAGKRVWCLYRVSTNQQVDHDEKNEAADIPMQRKACHRFAKKNGLDDYP